MTKRPLRLLLEFVAITAPVTWWWMHGGQGWYWQEIYKGLAFPILAKLGVTTFPPALVRDRLLNFLPFVALMLITPRLSRRRRFGGIVIGLIVIFAGQIALAWWAYITHTVGERSTESMSKFFPATMISDALPFVLWAGFASQFLAEMLAKVLPAPPRAASGPSAEGGQKPAIEPESDAPASAGASERDPDASP